ncbi:MAG TPA: DUF6064 family protein [Bacteroidia bacterium]|nr:DUF6064 family protein [Bacteroidia bacterium]
MNTPFTIAQFFEVFKNYNETVFPAQILLYLVAFITIYLIIKPTALSNKIISGLLAFFWLWMGIVYHLIFFTKINDAAYIFGAIFILQALLFLAYGVFNNKLSFSFHPDIYGLTGIVLILFALILYPILGFSLGHVYPLSPTFGLPCPTTILTLGILLLGDKKFPLVIFIMPLLWSIIGFTAAFNFGIWEDTGLLVAGILTTILLLIKNRKYGMVEQATK